MNTNYLASKFIGSFIVFLKFFKIKINNKIKIELFFHISHLKFEKIIV